MTEGSPVAGVNDAFVQFSFWFRTLGVGAILGILLRFLILQRRAKNDEVLTSIKGKEALALAAIEQTKTDDARDKDIRDHYADEVRQLRAAMEAQSRRYRAAEIIRERAYRRTLKEADERAAECSRDRERMRIEFQRSRESSDEKIVALKELVDGLNRTVVQYSADAVIKLGDVASPDVQAAARRVKELFAAKEEGDTK